ncbi:hypothetical protein E4U13_007100 [Claviceps humidiphila]|uniref:Uncharacterized protein n=1 Tax=Claviceps humidiphila TaxID=1294629 RepID=A0A9P7TSX3_9HYPO|nr:hypothetical protein E4U13_007100 [Claviceps humidiphila]
MSMMGWDKLGVTSNLPFLKPHASSSKAALHNIHLQSLSRQYLEDPMTNISRLLDEAPMARQESIRVVALDKSTSLADYCNLMSQCALLTMDIDADGATNIWERW